MDAPERLALTTLCSELAELRRECAQQPEPRHRLLARIEEEAAARRPILPLLERLLGVDGTDTMRAVGVGLPGAGPGQADEETFGCPDGACDRIAGTTPAGPIPRCLLTGQPLRRR